MRRAVFRSCLRPKTYEAPVCQGASVTSTSREARAHLRNYSVVIPPDCVAAINQEDGKHALDYMQRALNAQILESASIDFKKLKSGITER
jgi:nicotinamidase-related amidase